METRTCFSLHSRLAPDSLAETSVTRLFYPAQPRRSLELFFSGGLKEKGPGGKRSAGDISRENEEAVY